MRNNGLLRTSLILDANENTPAPTPHTNITKWLWGCPTVHNSGVEKSLLHSPRWYSGLHASAPEVPFPRSFTVDLVKWEPRTRLWGFWFSSNSDLRNITYSKWNSFHIEIINCPSSWCQRARLVHNHKRIKANSIMETHPSDILSSQSILPPSETFPPKNTKNLIQIRRSYKLINCQAEQSQM